MCLERLADLAKIGCVPFDLDFMRALGFGFAEDWDGQVTITAPEEIEVGDVIKLMTPFHQGIKTRLYFEGQRAKSVFVGGPLNGKDCGMMRSPFLCHLERGKWVVYKRNYSITNDPRAWYMGKAKNKKEARLLGKLEIPDIAAIYGT
jgi:hypothetical protein